MLNKVKSPAVGGYCRIQADPELHKTLIRAGVNSDKMSSGRHHTWVPRWVKNAVEMYKKGDGFAGLTLEEFLMSMRPDKSE